MQYKYMVLLSSLIFFLVWTCGVGHMCGVCVYLFMWLCAQIHVGVAACRGQRLETCLYLSTLCMFIFFRQGLSLNLDLTDKLGQPADEFRDLPLCRSRLPALGLQMSHICLASYSSWGSELCAHRTGSLLTKPSRGPHAYLWCWHLHLVIPVFLNDPLLFFFHSLLSIHLYMREYII